MLLCVSLAFDTGHAGSDIERVVRRETEEYYKYLYGAAIKKSYLNEGLCFTPNDSSDSVEKCSNQPDCKFTAFSSHTCHANPGIVNNG